MSYTIEYRLLKEIIGEYGKGYQREIIKTNNFDVLICKIRQLLLTNNVNRKYTSTYKIVVKK